MYLDISRDGVALRQADVTTDLYASYRGRLSRGTLLVLLAEHDAGELSEHADHVMVPVATLRRLAAGRVSEDDLGVMLATARERGRLSADGDAVHAPLERER